MVLVHGRWRCRFGVGIFGSGLLCCVCLGVDPRGFQAIESGSLGSRALGSWFLGCGAQRLELPGLELLGLGPSGLGLLGLGLSGLGLLGLKLSGLGLLGLGLSGLGLLVLGLTGLGNPVQVCLVRKPWFWGTRVWDYWGRDMMRQAHDLRPLPA